MSAVSGARGTRSRVLSSVGSTVLVDLSISTRNATAAPMRRRFEFNADTQQTFSLIINTRDVKGTDKKIKRKEEHT